jgi:hypothetical protein
LTFESHITFHLTDKPVPATAPLRSGAGGARILPPQQEDPFW